MCKRVVGSHPSPEPESAASPPEPEPEPAESPPDPEPEPEPEAEPEPDPRYAGLDIKIEPEQVAELRGLELAMRPARSPCTRAGLSQNFFLY